MMKPHEIQAALAATPLRVATCVALVMLGLGLTIFRDYGVTLDEPVLFYAGDRTLFWLEHPGAKDALNFDVDWPEGFHSSYQRELVRDDPLHFPVLPGLATTIGNRLFHDKLGLISELDARNLSLLLFNCLGLFLYAYFACRFLGCRAGFLAAITVLLYPTAVSHVFNDAKDWPCGLFYGVMVLAAGVAVVEASPRGLLVAAALLGIALSCKINAVFAALTVLLWTPLALWLLRSRERRPAARFWMACLAAPLVAVTLFIALWPWLYEGGTTASFQEHLRGYLSWIAERGHSARATWTAYPLRCVLYMTPPVVLLTALWALLLEQRRDRPALARWSLLLLWLLVPLVRISMPHSNFYDASRHFIEYIPALGALAGMGAAALWQRRNVWLGRIPLLASPRRLAIAAGIVALAAAAGVVSPVVAYHPYEGAYFNFLIGGLGGAQRVRLFDMGLDHDPKTADTEGDYWYSSVRQCIALFKTELAGGKSLGLCGAWPFQAGLDWGPPGFLHVGDLDADLVYATARNGCINRMNDSGQPLLHEERRGGGTIFRVYGKANAPGQP